MSGNILLSIEISLREWDQIYLGNETMSYVS